MRSLKLFGRARGICLTKLAIDLRWTRHVCSAGKAYMTNMADFLLERSNLRVVTWQSGEQAKTL